MSLPRVSLSSFLATAKATLNTAVQHAQPITFVVGNESADLDSICSAITYAYVRTYTSIPPVVHVPVTNIPAADISLRTELNPILSHVGVKASELITLSDLPHPTKRLALLSPENTRWFLVDHNSLQGDLGRMYSSRVVGCIDHHDDENKVPRDCGPEPRIIEKSGSCASLIINYCKEVWGRATQGDESRIYDCAWARVGLAPILIDTTNLTNKDKVTSHDLAAVKILELILKTLSLENYDRDNYYKEVNDAKQAIDDLSLNDILRKDYKQWTEGQDINLGISSSVKDVRFLLNKAENEVSFWKELQAFAENDTRKLSIFAIMTSFTRDGQYGRELLLLGLDEAGVKAVKSFEKNLSQEIGLQTWERGRLDNAGSENQWRRCWVQTNLAMSRKQVGPLLRKSVI